MIIRALVVLSFALAVPTPAAAGWNAPPPPDLVTVTAAAQALTLWPYTASDFSGEPSDPVNLVFPNADPRAVRQELMKLDGQRPPFATVRGGDCIWMDAMGYEQAAYAEPEGWVGGEVQLACVDPEYPLGSPFRFHLRLFRSGTFTLGAAHFEVLITGTAEHEVLSWDFAPQLVAFDVARTQTLQAEPESVALGTPGYFRAVRRPIYDGLGQSGAGPLLAFLGLQTPSTSGTNVPIPTMRQALVLQTAIAFEPVRADLRTAVDVTYDVITPKPFCASGPADYVRLRGPVSMRLRVHTTPSGKYDRVYTVTGSLEVTPIAAGSAPVNALVFEGHRGLLTDQHGQVVEQVSQVLLGDPHQSLLSNLAAGHLDRASRAITCGLAE